MLLDLALLTSLSALPAHVERLDQRHSQAILDLRVLARELAAQARRDAVAEVVQAIDKDPRLPPPLSTAGEGQVLTVYRGRAAWRPASSGAATPISLANGGFGADVSTGLTAGYVARVGAAGGIEIAALQAGDVPALDAAKVTSGTFATAQGGTGVSSYTAGDMLYYAGGTALTKLAAGAANTLLTGGTTPAWSATPTVTTLTGSTSLLTPLLDRASAGTLNMGPTATTIALRSNNVRIQSAGGGDGLWIVGSTSVTCYAGTFDTPASNITFNWGNSTGPFTLSQGNVSWTGALNSTLSLVASGSSGTALIQTQGSGAHLSLRTTGTSAYVLLDGTTGVVVRRNSANFCDFGNTASTTLTLAAGISLAGAAGAGGLSCGSMTGDTTLPTGSISWTAALNKTLTLAASGNVSVTTGGAMTLSNFSGSSQLDIRAGGQLLFIGFSGITMQRNATTLLDVGVSSSTAVTLGIGTSLSASAGSGGLSLGSMTGNWTMPTGSGSWTGASNKTLTLTSSGISGNISISAGGGGLLSLNSTYRVSLLYSSGERLRVDSDLTLRPLVTPPAGGSTAARVLLSDVADFGVYWGTGAPTVVAAQGSLYLRRDGSGTGDRMYVNIDGSTGWTAVTTAA